jgi:N6-L-threonylcarbamoyladenine synthase
LENLALSSFTETSLPVVTQDLTVSFSGPESAAQRSIKEGKAGADVARQVFHCIGRSLFEVTLRAVRQYRINRVLLVGGVASNNLIKDYLTRTGAEQGIEIIFSKRQYASDNAVGIALIGYDGWKRGTLG